MSKSVLISIQPYYVFLIIAKAMGWDIPQEKTIEVRKTIPRDKDWNRKAIIYCSKNKKYFAKIPRKYQPLMESFLGKVIGEFVCYRIDTYDDDTIHSFSYEDYCSWNDFELNRSCIHPEDFESYANGKWLYGWHISDLKIYDNPKELSNFFVVCKKECCDPHCISTDWDRDKNGNIFYECKYGGYTPLFRPPQSWCYVERLVGEE